MGNSKLLIPQSVLSQSQSRNKAVTVYCAITFTTSDRPAKLWNCSQCNIHALSHGIFRSDPHRIFLNLPCIQIHTIAPEGQYKIKMSLNIHVMNLKSF